MQRQLNPLLPFFAVTLSAVGVAFGRRRRQHERRHERRRFDVIARPRDRRTRGLPLTRGLCRISGRRGNGVIVGCLRIPRTRKRSVRLTIIRIDRRSRRNFTTGTTFQCPGMAQILSGRDVGRFQIRSEAVRRRGRRKPARGNSGSGFEASFADGNAVKRTNCGAAGHYDT